MNFLPDAIRISKKCLPLYCIIMREAGKNKKVFVSGCYDLLHSGHVEFFRQASRYGDLYVGIGSDETVLHYKNHRTLYGERERLFMVKAIRYVKDAYINAGSGIMDFVPTIDIVRPDVFVVNEDGSTEEKRRFCEERGIEYVVLRRTPQEGLEARSSTSVKNDACRIPTRLDLAGTWIDQPYVSCHVPGWAITISLEPTFEVRDRCGLSTSTRNVIRKIWPLQLPDMDPEMLARLVFCFENHPERSAGFVSGAQDAIGICVPGLCRHYYDGHFWPERIERCGDEAVLSWLEEHLCLVLLAPRREGCSVVAGKDITKEKVEALAAAADACWKAILERDLEGFASAYRASFEAQVSMFPGMVDPVCTDAAEAGAPGKDDGGAVSIRQEIGRYRAMPGVLAWKMPGAGGGGYLALVCRGRDAFPEGAVPLTIRRSSGRRNRISDEFTEK